ncbi:hypothetical protein CFP56_011439 [Quercus suber]|uniref:Uncharacterized protein n=1 Tax=Quercus suber TaxID=58331 RepID=A0AAW0M3Q2_QUESU
MEAIAKTFTLLWKTKKGFEIRDMGDHMVLGDSLLAKEIVSIAGNVDSRALEEGCRNAFNFIQLRVAVDKSKPFCRGHKIAMANGKEGWVSFKDCPLWEQSRGTLRGRDQQFGAWLLIRVARIEDDERSEGGDLKGDNKGMELVLGRNGDDDME